MGSVVFSQNNHVGAFFVCSFSSRKPSTRASFFRSTTTTISPLLLSSSSACSQRSYRPGQPLRPPPWHVGAPRGFIPARCHWRYRMLHVSISYTLPCALWPNPHDRLHNAHCIHLSILQQDVDLWLSLSMTSGTTNLSRPSNSWRS